MEIIIKYIADDGTEFKDEEECLNYERVETVKALQGVKFFFENGKEITDYSNLEDLLERSFIIRITNKNDFDKFEEMFYNELGCHYWAAGWNSLQGETGLFFYEEEFDRWMSWDEWYDKLQEIRRTMNYYSDSMGRATEEEYTDEHD